MLVNFRGRTRSVELVRGSIDGYDWRFTGLSHAEHKALGITYDEEINVYIDLLRAKIGVKRPLRLRIKWFARRCWDRLSHKRVTFEGYMAKHDPVFTEGRITRGGWDDWC